MKKRTQLNIEINEDLLKSLKFMALSKNIKLNALVKEILAEKIKPNFPQENNRNVLDELDEIKGRISELEK
tara:strand:+ start:453 stop:665 length:213 start_codon:yes stop_codon:yes gene_type:complete